MTAPAPAEKAKRKPAPKLPELSPEQSAAMADAEKRLAPMRAKKFRDRKLVTLGGWAGAGKTTLIAHMLRRSKAKVCAFTGKAAFVLTTKGVPATTIHSLIYQCFQACDDCGKGEGSCKCASPAFKLRWSRVPDIDAELVIVDEASMVDRRLLDDLESFGVPLLCVGDHGQLEPVGDDPKLMRDPDIRLETIHRQAADSPIIRFAHHVRQGHEPESFGPATTVMQGLPADLRPYDAILCGFNKTRVAVNAKVRRQLGFAGLLVKGERVICRRNDKEHGIFNGMLATVERVDGETIDVVDDMGTRFKRVPFMPAQLDAEQVMKDPPKGSTLWMRGYCITVHSSQGSEWDRVLVLEQLAKIWEPARWRYTAATRAAKELTWCLPTRTR